MISGYQLRRILLYFVLVALCAAALNSEAFIGDFVYPDDYYRAFIYNRTQTPLEVIVGKEGWLYKDADLKATYLGKPYSEAELIKIRSFFEKLKGYAKARGIKVMFFISPTTPSIYPEYLPATVKIKKTTPVDQLYGYLATHSIVDVIYPKKVLLKEKDRHKLYYKNDAHWTEMGAFWGTRNLMEHASKWFPAISLHPLTDYKLVSTRNFGGTLSKLINIEPVLLEDVVSLESKFALRDAASLPKALIIHDSYYYNSRKYIRENFNVIDAKFFKGDRVFNEDDMSELVHQMDSSKPDVLILFFCERGYDRLLGRHS